MFIMESSKVILLWFIFGYMKKTESTTRGDYDVDGFIKKLMNSHKFEQLADVIAEKAALKIKNYGRDSDALPRNDESINEKEEDLPRKISEDHEHHASQEDEQLHDEIKKKSKFIVIDNKAFMEKAASQPSETLSLKYKYLSKNIPKEKIVETVEQYNKDSEEMDKEKSRKRKSHKNFSYEDVKQNENIRGDKYSEEAMKLHKKPKQNVQMRPHQTHGNKELKADTNVESKRNNRISSKEEPGINSSNYDVIKNSVEAQESNEEESENDDPQPVLDDLDEIKRKVFRSNIEEDSTMLNNSKTIPEDDKNQYRNSVNNTGIPDSAEQSNNEDKIQSSTVKMYRKEGDKIFTFQSSPEYAEYHEQVAKLQNRNMDHN